MKAHFIGGDEAAYPVWYLNFLDCLGEDLGYDRLLETFSGFSSTIMRYLDSVFVRADAMAQAIVADLHGRLKSFANFSLLSDDPSGIRAIFIRLSGLLEAC